MKGNEIGCCLMLSYNTTYDLEREIICTHTCTSTWPSYIVAIANTDPPHLTPPYLYILITKPVVQYPHWLPFLSAILT